MEPGEYEKIRLKNLEDNKRVLAAFGLMNPFKPVRCLMQKSSRPVKKPSSVKKRSLPVEDVSFCGSLYGSRRKSARLSGQVAGEGLDLGSTYDELDEVERKKTYTPTDRPNFYGPVPGIDVGTEWDMRIECSRDGVHRPTVAGIHGGPDGAYSIALSGGYEDDVDLGDCFTYTGEGGRDLKGTKANPKNLRTAPQSRDQTLTRGNLALSRNVETGNPVRVIRGYKLHSQFAPEEGYRYDGIYTVEKYWFTTGLSGYGVWKFALKRCSDQAASPWQFLQESTSVTNGAESVTNKENEAPASKTEPESQADGGKNKANNDIDSPRKELVSQSKDGRSSTQCIDGDPYRTEAESKVESCGESTASVTETSEDKPSEQPTAGDDLPVPSSDPALL